MARGIPQFLNFIIPTTEKKEWNDRLPKKNYAGLLQLASIRSVVVVTVYFHQ
jgi:hypothetical protein